MISEKLGSCDDGEILATGEGVKTDTWCIMLEIATYFLHFVSEEFPYLDEYIWNHIIILVLNG